MTAVDRNRPCERWAPVLTEGVVPPGPAALAVLSDGSARLEAPQPPSTTIGTTPRASSAVANHRLRPLTSPIF